MIDCFEIRVENLESKQDKKKKSKRKKIDNSFSSIVESIEEYIDCKLIFRNYYVLHGKRNSTTINCWDLKAMVNKQQKKEKKTTKHT